MDVLNVGDRIICADKFDMQSYKTELEEQGYKVQIELLIVGTEKLGQYMNMPEEGD